MKKILVTGGSKGIGLECVKNFLAQGWHVICCSREISTWNKNKEKFPELQKVEYYACDVANENDVATMFNTIKKNHGDLDAAINNASPKLASSGNFDVVKIDSMRETLESDLWSVVLCLKYELDLIKENGSIVNVTSINGIRPIPGAAMYGASKHAVESLTKSIALEAVSNNIRVNSVAPGVTWTPRWDARAEDNPNIRQDVEEIVPIKRFADPTEIVNAIDWLISDKSSYVVGHTLVVDGGLSLK